MIEYVQNLNSALMAEFTVIYNLFFAILCGIGIFVVFYITHKEISVNRSFAYTLILLPPIAAMVSILVSNDIVLAVGMLGALSIIRFRYSMKESKNLVYVFWSVTAGIASGLSFRFITLIWCGLLAALVLLIHFFSRRRRSGAILIKTSGSTEDIESILNGFSVKFDLKYSSKNEASELLYEFRHKKGVDRIADKIICEKIMQLKEVTAVRFIDI